jgi:hypothetical protein
VGFVVDQKEASKEQEEGNGASFHSTGEWKQRNSLVVASWKDTHGHFSQLLSAAVSVATLHQHQGESIILMAWNWYTNRFTAPAKNANLFLNSQMPIFFLNSCPSFLPQFKCSNGNL